MRARLLHDSIYRIQTLASKPPGTPDLQRAQSSQRQAQAASLWEPSGKISVTTICLCLPVCWKMSEMLAFEFYKGDAYPDLLVCTEQPQETTITASGAGNGIPVGSCCLRRCAYTCFPSKHTCHLCWKPLKACLLPQLLHPQASITEMESCLYQP